MMGGHGDPEDCPNYNLPQMQQHREQMSAQRTTGDHIVVSGYVTWR
jgi:hypothetical protein